MNRPYVLSIAGFDPSNGAGITADIKAFEMAEVMGLGICTAVTVQNEDTFNSVDWIAEKTIIDQINILFEKYTIDYVKIGLIESLTVLEKVISTLREKNPSIKIILDPILKATAGFTFHGQITESFFELCKQLYLITPNREEIIKLTSNTNKETQTTVLSEFCNVFLKGGHSDTQKGTDLLFLKGEKTAIPFTPQKLATYDKHGSGCVLSAVITAELAKGYYLTEACQTAKNYITDFLNSNETLLGFHYNV